MDINASFFMSYTASHLKVDKEKPGEKREARARGWLVKHADEFPLRESSADSVDHRSSGSCLPGTSWFWGSSGFVLTQIQSPDTQGPIQTRPAVARGYHVYSNKHNDSNDIPQSLK